MTKYSCDWMDPPSLHTMRVLGLRLHRTCSAGVTISYLPNTLAGKLARELFQQGANNSAVAGPIRYRSCRRRGRRSEGLLPRLSLMGWIRL